MSAFAKSSFAATQVGARAFRRPPRVRAALLLGTVLVLASAALADAEVVQKDHVRVKLLGELSPKTLPRSGKAPIAVRVGGRISTTDGSETPRLRTMKIELNQEGEIDSTGLPVCRFEAIEPASTSRAKSACRRASVGEGSFEAEVGLPGQESSQVEGRLLAFNGRSHGRPVLFAHIYSPSPFPTSFVIVFEIKRAAGGNFGSALVARLPKSLGSWGKLTGIDLRLDRRYSAGGRRHSYLSAGCPAPKGFNSVPFPLARTSFQFAGGLTLRSTMNRTCRAR